MQPNLVEIRIGAARSVNLCHARLVVGSPKRRELFATPALYIFGIERRTFTAIHPLLP
jgi:hypothetical protein